jgi:thiol-disulfide isomerase/thioredoxin
VRIGESDPVFDFQLQPTGPYRGRVVDERGQPVAGAKVYVATGFQHLDLTNLADSFATEDSNQRVKTDQHGAFEILPQMERYELVVVTADGYGQASRQADEVPGEVPVRRLASVRGRLSQAGKPMGSQRIFLEPISFTGGDAPRIDNRFFTQTEADGTFVFPRVPPIACRVRPFLHFSVDSPLKSSQSAPIVPQPGEEIDIVLGGDGAEVIGQLEIEGQSGTFDYHYALSFLVALRPGIEPPPELAAKGFNWQTGWSDSWRSSQEGQAYLNTLHHWFVKPDPDGRFRISGVPPGDYEFAVSLYGSTEGCLLHPLGQRVLPIAVEPGQSTLDLAKLSIPSLALPKLGDLAADFSIGDPNGGMLKLSDLRGKTVLVDFWATWCGPCVAGLDKVEQLRRQYGDERLAVVGVNLDAEQERAREFLAGRKLPWRHALLGDWSTTDIPKRYAISTIPAYVLIAPDGRILAHEYELEKIAAELEKGNAIQADQAGK